MIRDLLFKVRQQITGSRKFTLSKISSCWLWLDYGGQLVHDVGSILEIIHANETTYFRF